MIPLIDIIDGLVQAHVGLTFQTFDFLFSIPVHKVDRGDPQLQGTTNEGIRPEVEQFGFPGHGQASDPATRLLTSAATFRP